MRCPALPVLLLIALPVLAQDGTFDASFNPTDQGMARFDGLHRAHLQGVYTDEGVRTMTVQPDGKLLVGGWFPGGPAMIQDPVFFPGIARLDTDGSQDPTFNVGAGFDGPIEVIVVQPNGKILVGGAFLNCQGFPSKGIARLNADGSRDTGFSVGTGTGGTVFEIALQADNKILLGGNFNLYNGMPAGRIVRLAVNGSYDGTFAVGAGFDAKVNAIAVQSDGRILVGGIFHSYQGAERNYLARLLQTGTLDAAYNDPSFADGPDDLVTDIAIGTAGTAYIAGQFIYFNGLYAPHVEHVNASCARMIPFNGLGYPAPRMHYDPIGNVLSIWGGGAEHGFAKLNGTTGAELLGYDELHNDWYYRTSCSYPNLEWWGSTVGPSGEVYRPDPFHTGILRLHSDLTLDADFRPGMGLGWLAEQLGISISSGGEVSLAGRYDILSTLPALNGVYLTDLINLDPSGEPDPLDRLPRSIEGSVDGVLRLGLDRMVLHGSITLVCGSDDSEPMTTSMLRYDRSTATFTPMNVPGGCDAPDRGPKAKGLIELASGKVLYFGQDTCSGGARDIGRFNLDATWDATYPTTDLAPLDHLPVCAAEAPDGRVYIGGSFTSANGLVRNRIVRLLANGGVDPSFDPLVGFDSTVTRMVVNPDGSVVCIGEFSSYRGTMRNRIARLLPTGALDPTFDPEGGFTNSPLCMVRYPDGRILVGGNMFSYNGQPVNAIACINADASLDDTFVQGTGFRLHNPAFPGGGNTIGTVRDMVMDPSGRVVCLGEFHQYNGNGRNRLARLGSGTSLMVNARVFLEGAYNGSGGMSALIPRALLPLREPYRTLGYTHVRGGSESTSASVMQAQGPGAIIDWVLVELRDPVNPTHLVATRSALLRADGWIADLDGVSPVRFPGVSMGQYHVAIRHRNHLGIMSEAPIFLGSQSIPIDFTGASYGTYGTNARKAVNGVHLLWAGDVNRDGQLKYTGQGNDRDPILLGIGGVVPTNSTSGYRVEDVNLDGVIKYTGQGNDRDPILQNIGGVVPTAIRQQQLP